MDRLSEKRQRQDQRRRRVRKKIVGSAARPRLTVYKSHRNISVQAVDDGAGVTLAAVSTLEKELAKVKKSVAGGEAVGRIIAERLKEAKVTTVVFDRNGYPYHGIIKAIADSARSTGLNF